MPKPAPSRHSYGDIMPYLDTALARGYLKITFDNINQAIHASQRMNKWRMIEREAGSTLLDYFVFSRTGRVVTIKPREVLKAVSIVDEDGNEIALELNTAVR